MKHLKQKAISLILGICLIGSCITMTSAANRPTCRNGAMTYRIVQVLTNNARLQQFMAQFFTAPKTQNEPAPSEPETCVDCDTPVEETPAPVEEAPERPTEPQVQSQALDYEKRVVALVNEQRRAYGLAPVELSEELCVKARVKSQDMAQNRYFDHNSPTYGSPFDMMRALGVTYRYAGENIAMGYSTPEAVVNAWMNSEGHRANILNANYRTLGVGYVAAGNYWTQWFIG